jgi:heterodisulfide reductase subunit B
LTMDYALYLGCIAPNRYPGIEASVRSVLGNLGVSLRELNGASCCPAPGVVKSFSKETWLALASRNISLAEEINKNLMTICNGCYGTLKEANEIIKTNELLKLKANEALASIGRTVNGSIEVKHIAEVLHNEIGVSRIRDHVKRKTPIKVAAHYGCHLLKPSDLRPWGSVERPRFLDDMIELTGAFSIPYKDKMLCCGAGGGVRAGAIDIALDMTREKLDNVLDAGADCIVDVCPFCHLQLDAGQVQLNKKLGSKYDIPILYYTQLLGISMGFEPLKMGVQHNMISGLRLFEKT